jgi:hypothetical protein
VAGCILATPHANGSLGECFSFSCSGTAKLFCPGTPCLLHDDTELWWQTGLSIGLVLMCVARFSCVPNNHTESSITGVAPSVKIGL